MSQRRKPGARFHNLKHRHGFVVSYVYSIVILYQQMAQKKKNQSSLDLCHRETQKANHWFRDLTPCMIPNFGCKFFFYFPLVPETHSSPLRAQLNIKIIEPKTSQQNKHIFKTDDVPMSFFYGKDSQMCCYFFRRSQKQPKGRSFSSNSAISCRNAHIHTRKICKWWWKFAKS